MASKLNSIQSNQPAPIQHAVVVRNASKSYGNPLKPIHVLTNLNMTVQQGQIYGLLGPSGCGKTTLLNCIIGLKWLDRGNIWVLGTKLTKFSEVPGVRVGYMPQQLSLFSQFTVKETALYFGWIFGMKTNTIIPRLNYLLRLLDLPEESYLVENLSGGQQRRVSFIVALLYDAELLILDEPTVGVDPLLRKHIWNFLEQILEEKQKTVIITTHYIDEARKAHTIGLMRNGILLAEDSPQNILNAFNLKRLEDVYLQLSRVQEEENPKENTPSVSQPAQVDENEIREELENLKKYQKRAPWWKTITNLGRLKALLYKNFLVMLRNRSMLFFVSLVPGFELVLFFTGVGKEPDVISLAVYSADAKSANESGLYCGPQPKCGFDYFFYLNTDYSCRVMDALENRSQLAFQYFHNYSSALASVEARENWGTVYFPNGFTDKLFFRWFDNIHVDNTSLEGSNINVTLDMSNQQIAYVLLRELLAGYIQFNMKFLKDCKRKHHLLAPPLKYHIPIYGATNPEFTDFMAPGVLTTLIFFMSVVLTTSSLLDERVSGILHRSIQAGVTGSDIVFCHVITQFAVLISQIALLLLIMFYGYHLHNEGELYLFLGLTIFIGLCGICFGFVISAICDTDRTMVYLVLGSFYPSVLLGGVLWPLEAMPIWLYWCARFLPISILTTALRAILIRGWSFGRFSVYSGFLGAISWSVLFLICSLTVFKYKTAF